MSSASRLFDTEGGASWQSAVGLQVDRADLADMMGWFNSSGESVNSGVVSMSTLMFAGRFRMRSALLMSWLAWLRLCRLYTRGFDVITVSLAFLKSSLDIPKSGFPSPNSTFAQQE